MDELLALLGQTCAVIGAQWGDEGKGKAIDLLADKFDVIARACGGANAGHTIVVGGKKHVFRLMPSASLHAGKTIVLGSGMVIHVPTLMEEVALLEQAGVEIASRLWISAEAHVLFDFHKEIDGALETRRGKDAIGTTKRGIGPAYMDKAARTGIRFGDLVKGVAAVKPRLENRIEDVRTAYGVTVDPAKEIANLGVAEGFLLPRIIPNLTEFLFERLSAGKNLLIEGAQATLLDIDHGTYPYVTSSSTTAAGALQGLGLPPSALMSCIGVAKAYCTRVGEGEFLTEADDERANRLRERGGEYGSVTGRPRRCGWLHLPDLRYAALVNGFNCWNITKLDVLDEEPVIPVGTGVDAAGKPVYTMLPGWKTSTVGITEFHELPPQAREFIKFVEDKTGIPAALVGTGRGREEMIVRVPGN